MPDTIDKIVKMTPVWNCNTSETTKSLHTSTIDFNVTMKMKILRVQLLNKLQKSTKRRQKTRKVMRMTHLSLRLIGSKAHCNIYRFAKTVLRQKHRYHYQLTLSECIEE